MTPEGVCVFSDGTYSIWWPGGKIFEVYLFENRVVSGFTANDLPQDQQAACRQAINWWSEYGESSVKALTSQELEF